jgi:ribose transport system ATP-binding protein
VSLSVREGEVLGIYGFLGSGQLELARTLFGAFPAERGRIALDGRMMRLSSTARARRAGLAFLPESRRMMLFSAEPVFKNMTIAMLDRIHRLWLRPKAEHTVAEKQVERLRIHRMWTAHSARCPAAISRRSPWRNGSPICLVCWC